MAFEYTIRNSDFLGKGIVAGNWTATGVTTGAITTGFNEVTAICMSNAVANTLTSVASGGTVGLTCTSGDRGTFLVYGS